MNKPAISKKDATKKPTNVSLNTQLVAQAKSLNINISSACERGLNEEVRHAIEVKWKLENKAAVESWNDWIQESGMPYDEYRQI
ncbi:post-segregation antitoxin CcdA [Sphingorhabdus lutea]|uniref:Post-segregation antitoxin CcdA n=1 Tax=Sphingorhabdus lutea TaxID=1913578 RepID=A0A1L3JB79_9SPHN|nr:type II toxin-antitoxin system CcdA family antitoxin [Sphingorhabdus lutea]APG62378.1 post-segregation antitoxin CcdA [Sphingorhabdus lutea]